MTGIILQRFTGIAPIYSPKQLAENMATVAENCTFRKGRLDPVRGISDLGASAYNNDSLFWYQGDWLQGQSIDYVGSLIPQDIRERIFSTDPASYPRIHSGGASYRLGIPRPATAPSAEVISEGDLTNEFLIRSQSYRCSFVDAWGAEGPLSLPSASVEVGPEGTTIVTLPATPTGNYNFGSGALIRIYRSNKGSAETDYQYAGEVPIGTASFADSLETDELQEVAPSAEWIGPPDDDTSVYPDGPLVGLIEIPGGSLAGFSGTQVCVSLPGLPHAWPLRYRFTTQFPIVGFVGITNGTLVLTTGAPYILAGTTAETLQLVKFESVEPCKSKLSIVDMGEYAIYAGADGLVAAQAGEATVITEGLIGPSYWREVFKPETIRAFRYEGKYVAFYGDIADGTGFIFDPAGDTASLTLITGEVTAGKFNPEMDRVEVIYRDESTQWRVGEFDAGDYLPMRWKGRHEQFPVPVNLAVIRVEADNYPVNVQLTVGGVVQPTLAIPDSYFHRIPLGVAARDWQIEINNTTGGVESLGIWDAISEVV